MNAKRPSLLDTILETAKGSRTKSPEERKDVSLLLIYHLLSAHPEEAVDAFARFGLELQRFFPGGGMTDDLLRVFAAITEWSDEECGVFVTDFQRVTKGKSSITTAEAFRRKAGAFLSVMELRISADTEARGKPGHDVPAVFDPDAIQACALTIGLFFNGVGRGGSDAPRHQACCLYYTLVQDPSVAVAALYVLGGKYREAGLLFIQYIRGILHGNRNQCRTVVAGFAKFVSVKPVAITTVEELRKRVRAFVKRLDEFIADPELQKMCAELRSPDA